MKYNMFKSSVLRHLETYKKETLGITENGVWSHNKKEYAHILPKELEKLNVLPMAVIPPAVKLHKDSHHLNSSQIMCINFFSPLMQDDNGKELLLKIIADETCIKFSADAKIINAQFEYEPDHKEGTNFDFFVEVSTGEKIYFEIKYTESEFASISTVKSATTSYDDKWNKVIVNHLNDSLYLKNISKQDFYKDYQVWRNVSYIKNQNDYVVFLFPYLNGKLEKEICDTVGFPNAKKFNNVLILCWCSFISAALELSINTKYYSHFDMFNEKYLRYTIPDEEVINEISPIQELELLINKMKSYESCGHEHV